MLGRYVANKLFDIFSNDIVFQINGIANLFLC